MLVQTDTHNSTFPGSVSFIVEVPDLTVDEGNWWLVTATSTFRFLGLEAFRYSLGEGHLLECLSQLGSGP